MRWLSARLVVLLAMAFVASIAIACSGAASPATMAPAAARPVSGDPSAQGNDGVTKDGGGDTAQVPGGSPIPALIVHTGSMDLEVSDLRATVDRATTLMNGIGGQVAESHESNDSSYQSATVTYRIPAARWDDAITGLRALGQKVLAEDTNAADVTTQVVDLDARIANLRASEAALQGIMTRAASIPDVLKVQQELSAVRGDIESMVAQRDNLADQAALGTLEVRFNVPVAAAATASNEWDLGTEVDHAVAALVRVGQGFLSLAVWVLIVILPVGIPVLVAIFVGVRVRRRYDSRRSNQPLAPPV